MRAYFSHTLRTDDTEQTELNDVRAYIVMAQDANDEFICASGSCADIHALFMYGAVNWQILPIDQDFRDALESACGPYMDRDKSVITVCSPTDLMTRTPENTEHGAWTTDIRIRHEDGSVLDLRGITDSLIFILDANDGKMKVGAAGSGLQKGKLLQRGIAAFFSEQALADFNQAFYGDGSPILTQLREAAITQSRKRDAGKPPGISTYALSLELTDDGKE